MPISGLHRLVRGKVAHVRVGKLALNLISSPRLSNDEWLDFLEGARRVSAGDHASVALILFTGAAPDATQRRLTVEWMTNNDVPEPERIALLTDSDVLRGALTAFSWLMPKVGTRSFAPAEHGRALRWLNMMVEFNPQEAAQAWRLAHEKMSLPFPETRSGDRPSGESISWLPGEPRTSARR